MTTLREALFAPKAVAIVGQSNDATKTAGRPLKFLRQMGYAGRVYPINPGRETVLGERAWPSLAALPETPDHAYIVTPTEAAIEAVAECGQRGVKAATVLADGFTEAGEVGDRRVAKLRAICAATGIRVVGPSSLGIVDLRSRAMLTANAAFDERELPAGHIFAASHSGSMIGALLSRGKARGLHFAGLVSVGNEIDLSLGEICQATLDDPGIDGYMLFLETMRHAETLRRFALAAHQQGKPIIAYKLGRSEAARELAVTHTGALAGEDDVADAFLADCGIARVDTLDGLIEGLPLLRRLPPPPYPPPQAGEGKGGGRRATVGVVTTTGGGATMVVDPLSSRGIAIERPSDATLARFKAAGIEVKPARIIDVTLAGARYDVMKAALDILTTAPEYDVILAVIGSSARFHPELAVKPIVDSASATKPLVACLVPDAPEALAMLSEAGVPNFRTPEACADAMAAALRRRAPRSLDRSWPGSSSQVGFTRLAQSNSAQLGQAQVAIPSTASEHHIHQDVDARDKHGHDERGGRLLDELEAGALLELLGVPRAPTLALDAGIAQAPVLPFAYPVAVKALTAEIAHKTEVGGVVLGVADGIALITAIAQIKANVAQHRPGTRLQQVLVQPMIAGLGEALIGYRVDSAAGPLVMVATGGILAELYRDRSLRLAPVDLATARDMIAEVRALQALAGFRGRPKGDLDALANAIVALSQLAKDPSVVEAEINPLIVRSDGVIAVDALVKRA